MSGLIEGVLRIYRAAGWNDKIAGKPFHPAYEQFNSLAQHAYERGRLEAANVMAAGMDPPPWRIGDPVPVNVLECVRMAEERVGPPSPRRIVSVTLRHEDTGVSDYHEVEV